MAIIVRTSLEFRLIAFLRNLLEKTEKYAGYRLTRNARRELWIAYRDPEAKRGFSEKFFAIHPDHVEFAEIRIILNENVDLTNSSTFTLELYRKEHYYMMHRLAEMLDHNFPELEVVISRHYEDD